MKSQTLPTKRKPVSKGMFRKLSVVTQGRRRQQRAATTAGARDFEDGHNQARIGRALFVILLIHLLAVAMIFVHHRFLSDRPAQEASAPKPEVKTAPAVQVTPNVTTESGVVQSQMAPDETPYIVSRGESYASIAAAHQISEQDLRDLNGNANIRAGYLLKIPVKRVVIKTPRPQTEAEPVTVQVQAPAAQAVQPAAVPARDQGLVDAVDTRNAPRANPISATTATGNKYVVQKNDTIWRIANRHGIDQAKLMQANGINDPRKLRVGMTLNIPR